MSDDDGWSESDTETATERRTGISSSGDGSMTVSSTAPTFFEKEGGSNGSDGSSDGSGSGSGNSSSGVVFIREETPQSRLVLGLVTVLSALYLQLAMRTVQILHCSERDGELRLNIDLSIRCYEGTHLGAVVVAWLVLVGFVVGFPAALTGLLLHSAWRGNWEALVNGYAFLTRGLHRSRFWFRLTSFALSFALVLETTLARHATTRAFLAAISFVVNTILVLWFWPYKKVWNSLLHIVLGLAAGLKTVIFLFVDDFSQAAGGESDTGTGSVRVVYGGLIAALLVVCLCVGVVVVWRRTQPQLQPQRLRWC